jgi:integrase/recombinase XerC
MMVEVEKFIDWVRMRSPQARTWRDYKSDLGLFRSVVEKQKVEEIQPKDLDHFVLFQVDKGYKPTTINRRLAAVASFYHFLAQNGRSLNCPVLPKRHYLREPQRLPRPLNEENLRKFFDAIQDVRDRAMFNLMLRCGLRIGEVAALQMPDLYLGEVPARMIIRGKGARERTVYLSSEAEHRLQDWLKQRPKVDNKHVFLSYQLRKLSTTSINVRINHVRKISGVDLTAHRLRHTFADHLLSAGVPITSIQKLMGHRFVETTQTYAVANDRQVQADFYQASEKLEGWRLLLGSVQSNIIEADFQVKMTGSEEPGSMREESDLPEIRPPEPILQLPNGLVRQLEAYRQWKVNRWRSERVIANSISYYSQQGILWAFFCENCVVKGVSDLRLEHVLQFVKTRLDAGRSPKTVNSSLSGLRSFLSFLKKMASTSIHLWRRSSASSRKKCCHVI